MVAYTETACQVLATLGKTSEIYIRYNEFTNELIIIVQHAIVARKR